MNETEKGPSESMKKFNYFYNEMYINEIIIAAF